MRKIILSLLGLIAAWNILQLSLQILSHQHNHGKMQLHNLGDQFKGLDAALNGQRRIGYYTDKNMDQTLAIAQFEQAQYLLAPAVLDLNHTDHPFVIFDCTSPQAALLKIKELGLQPVKASNTGIILTFNPHMQGSAL